MGPMMFFVSLVVIFVMVDITPAQTGNNVTRCDNLSKVESNVEILMKNNPLTYHFSNCHLYDCSKVVFVGPERGTNNNTGSCIAVRGSSALIFDFLKPPNSTVVYATQCDTGEKTDVYFLKFEFGPNGGYFCDYVCSNGGLTLQLVRCAATDSSFIEAEQQAILLLNGIPIVDQIYNSNANCTKPKSCAAFN